MTYDRQAAVRYAHTWAYRRNPRYYDFSELGGDCTNFASQCLFAGAGIMDPRRDLGWYYYSVNDRAPAWTGVEFFARFLTRDFRSIGPYAVLCSIDEVEPGDFVQLRFEGQAQFGHTPVIVSTGVRPTPETVLVAAHSYDTDYRPLSTYPAAEIRFFHIAGVRK